MKAGIVGAGIMGRLLAFNLVNAGWDVSLFDQNPADDKNSECSERGESVRCHSDSSLRSESESPNKDGNVCSMVAGGLLTPISELDKAEKLIFHLGQAALDTHWPNIISQLFEPIYFQKTGTLTLAHPNDHAELGHFISRISRCLQGGHSERSEEPPSNYNDSYQKLTQTDITQLEPEITKFHQGYYFPQEGHIDSQTLFYALGRYLKERGVSWYNEACVETVEPFKISVDNIAQKFDMVFDCRGLGAKSLFDDLRGVRGELIWLHAPDVHISRPIRFLHPRYSLYIVPRPQNIYLVGASEIESEDFGEITVQSSLELLTAAYSMHSGFAQARILKSVTHCRPTLSDHLPRVKVTKGLIAINGLYRHGYLIAPSIAHDVLQWLTQDKAAVCYPELWEIQ